MSVIKELKELVEGYQIIKRFVSNDPMVKRILGIERGTRVMNLGFSWAKGQKKPNWADAFLRDDGWFRLERTEGGIMFREVILNRKMERYRSFNLYSVSVLIYNDTEGAVDDTKMNWERYRGWLWVSNDPKMPDVQEIIAWMNKVARSGGWVP